MADKVHLDEFLSSLAQLNTTPRKNGFEIISDPSGIPKAGCVRFILKPGSVPDLELDEAVRTVLSGKSSILRHGPQLIIFAEIGSLFERNLTNLVGPKRESSLFGRFAARSAGSAPSK